MAFQMFQARLDLLDEVEKDHVVKKCRESESVFSHPPPPVCPKEPPMPGLYHLRNIFVDVALPWTWDNDSGEKFVNRWSEDMTKAEFRDKLMRLSYWWIRKKVSVTCLLYVSISV